MALFPVPSVGYLSCYSLFYFCGYKAEWPLQGSRDVRREMTKEHTSGTYAECGSSAGMPRGLKDGLLPGLILFLLAAAARLSRCFCAHISHHSRTKELLIRSCLPSSVFLLSVPSSGTSQLHSFSTLPFHMYPVQQPFCPPRLLSLAL